MIAPRKPLNGFLANARPNGFSRRLAMYPHNFHVMIL